MQQDLNSLSDEELARIAGVTLQPRQQAPQRQSAPQADRGTRNANAGNLKASPWTQRQPGYVGQDPQGFAVFDSPQSGEAAQVNLLRTNYAGMSPSQVVNKYAPIGPENSPESVANYIAYAAQRAGIDPNQPIPEAALPSFAQAMREFETGQTQGGGQPQAQAQEPDLNSLSDEELMQLAGITPNAASQAVQGSSQDNPIDLTGRLYQDQVDALKQGAWVRAQNGEVYQLPGDAFTASARSSDEAQGGNVFMRRPNLEDRLGAAATAFVEQVPGGDEALAGITGALSGQGYDAARESQMVNRELLNQTNRGARNVGGVAGAVIPALALPGAGWVNGARGAGQVGRAAAVGAGYGALYGAGNTDGGLSERATGAAWGSGAGLLTGGLFQGLGNAFSRSGANAAANPSPQRQLSQMGVELTPGQMAGGGWQRIEDGLISTPVLGDSIRNAQRRGLESYNRAVYDWALEPIGRAVPRDVNVGRNGYRAAEDIASGAYDSALSGVTVDPAQGFNQALASVRAGPQMQGEAAATLANTVDDLERRFASPLSGEAYKQIESEVNAAIRSASSGAQNNPALRPMIDRLSAIRKGLQDSFDAADPFAGADKSKADEAYARVIRLREAQQRQGTAMRDGLFTAGDFDAAVRKGDSTAGNRAYARGEALGQQLSDAGQAVLPRTVPDSGTPFRSILQVLAGLGIGGTAANVGVPGATPVMGALIGAGGAGAGLYSRPVQGALNAAYRAHAPGSVRRATGGLFGRAAPRSAALEQGVLQWLLNQPRDDQALLRGR